MLVIPAVDLIAGRCVRLYQGDYNRTTAYEKDPVKQVVSFQKVGFPRLHVVDLEGARLGSGKNRAVIQEMAQLAEVPVQVGGGIRTPQDITELLEWGIRYLILGTVVLERPDLVTKWVNFWGPDSFIVSLDLKKKQLQSRGWLKTSTVTLDEIIKRLADWGIRQVICTDVERDGTLGEPSFEIYEDLKGQLATGTTLIAAGGISSPEHIARLKEMEVDGAIVGRALYESKIAWEDFVDAG